MDISTFLEERSDHPFSVLIADDGPVVRNILKRYLTEIAEAIHEAENGELAVRKRFEEKPNLILMDLEMPRMNGIEATRQIRRREREEELDPVSILFQTGSIQDNCKQRGLEAGADGFLRKPFEESDLLEAIHSVL